MNLKLTKETTLDIADSAKQTDTITYCFAPGCQNVLEPGSHTNKSAGSVFPPQPNQSIAVTPTRGTTGNGYANKVGSALFSVIAKTATKDHKNG